MFLYMFLSPVVNSLHSLLLLCMFDTCRDKQVHVVTNGHCKRFKVDNVGTVAAGLSAWLAIESIKVSYNSSCNVMIATSSVCGAAAIFMYIRAIE